VVPSLELALAVAGGVAMLAGSGRAGKGVQEELFNGFFLAGLVVFFGWFVVRLDRGYLRLTMIGTQASAMVLAPPMAGLVGLVAGLSWFRHGPNGYRYLGIGATIFWTATASLIRSSIGGGSEFEAAIGLASVALWMTLVNWAHTLASLAVLTGEPVGDIAKSAFSRAFVAAFVYFSLAAVLIANMIDGSVGGYLLAVVVALLSVTLTETIAERRRRAALEAQVADNQRYVGYSRAMEGVAHSLRHQLAISKGYLEDVLESKLAHQPRGRAQAAKASTDVALQILDRISASTSPKVVIAREPVNLKDIAVASAELVRGRAEGQGTHFEVTGKARPVRVSGDPALLREVVTELSINALDAAGHGGAITLTVSKRRGGWGALSVADSGPGIVDDQREHLFEPHYTTKPEGTGMGLFTAFGVVREHGGKLVYEGSSKRGAVFTILIPTVTRSAEGSEPVAVAGDGLNPAVVAERLSR
jgi:signal transduction histidine kinase